MPRHRDDDERGGRPGLDELLPSLAQQVRGRQLGVARWILYILGALMAVVGLALTATAETVAHKQIERELDEDLGGRQNVPPDKWHVVEETEQRYRRALRLVGAMLAGIGALYVLFGVFVKLFPVPITVTALALYIAGNAVTLVTSKDPGETLAAGWIFKLIIIIIVLARSIHAAVAYEKERRRTRQAFRRRYEEEDEEDDD